MGMVEIIVDEYLNYKGELRVALRSSLTATPQRILDRAQTERLIDALRFALSLKDEPRPTCIDCGSTLHGTDSSACNASGREPNEP